MKKGFILMLGNFIQGPDMLIIMVVVLLVFGPKNLPKLARSIGSSVTELKKGLNGEVVEHEDENVPAKSTAPKDSAKESR